MPANRRLSVVRMSATVREDDGARSFMLLSHERRDPGLRPRLEAHKAASLIEVPIDAVKKKTREARRDKEQRHRQKLVEKIGTEARRLAEVGTEGSDGERPRVIGVVVNRVAIARQVYELLSNNGLSADCQAFLLTGRIRPFDRDRLLEEWLPWIKAGRKREPETTLFVVATQTVEVGANLDFDALVTEAAPLDALRQRFGRLDRLGRRHERGASTPASIVIRSDQARKSEDDLLYGPAIAGTWQWLKRIASKVGRGAAKRSIVDFGINRLDEELSVRPPEDMAAVLTQPAECPLLFPAHLDVWVQTNPPPEPDPDVAPFLHGRADAPADVQVVWRADLDPERHSVWWETASLMPPLTREALPVPVYAVRTWLKATKGTGGEDVVDVEGKRVLALDTSAERQGRRVLRWRGSDATRVGGPDDVRPGDTIVVPAEYGGCDQFGWNPLRTGAVDDIADRCLAELVASYPNDAFRRPKLRVRLHPALLPQPDEATQARLGAMLSAAVAAERSEGDAWPAIRRLFEAMGSHLADPCVKSAVAGLLTSGGRVVPYPGNGDGIVIVNSLPLDVSASLTEDERGEDEPEGDGASFDGIRVSLTEHLDNVGSVAEQFASGAGLDDGLVRALGLAGRWHDEGKRDIRFQAWLHGSELKALAASEPVAKSGRDRWSPSTTFGYPLGARHEFVSVRLLEQADLPCAGGSFYDLVKFIIGTHHGFGRPFPPVDRDTSPVRVSLVRDGRELAVSSSHQLHSLDSGWVDLFWSMVHRFGWWGLAYLEALLVTADRTVSASDRSGNTATGRAVA